MRKHVGVIIGATVAGMASLALVLSFGANAAAGSAKQEIMALEHQLIAATTADEAMRVYDDNADLFNLTGPPLEYKGSRAIHDSFNDFFSNVKDFKGEFVELEVVSDGKMGMARSIQHFTWKDKDGKPADVTDRVTDVLQKEKTGWKIIHSHVSVPIDPKTGQGQMNLKS